MSARAAGSIGLLTSVLAAVLIGSPTASAQQPPPSTQPSDDRATFVPKNLATCADAGFPDAVQVYGQHTEAAGDAYVQGSGYGSQPTKVQVEITPEGEAAGVVIDAVVVKGSEGSNVYQSPHVPPQLAAPQDYISPKIAESGNVADVSHYLICYRFEEQPQIEAGSLLVLKRVLATDGVTSESRPTAYTVNVTCTPPSGDPINDTVTFGAGGGIGTASTGGRIIRGIPEGSTCTVVEQGTDSLPPGTTVSYLPATAPNPGVTMGNTRGTAVVVTNEYCPS